MIGIDYKKFLEHHLAVFYMTGKWPEHEVDHINNVRDDNRWDNLRPVTRAENNRNKKRDRPGKVGFTGVHLCGEKYRAAFNDDYKTTHIGVFATIAEARVARLLMEIDKFGLCTSFCERDEVLPIGDGRFMKIELVRSDTDGLIAYDSHGVPVHVKSVETVTDLIAAWHGGEWPASKIDEDKFSAGVTNALVGFGA